MKVVLKTGFSRIAKRFIFDIWYGCEYTSEIYCKDTDVMNE